jgi:hypothetical protein
VRAPIEPRLSPRALWLAALVTGGCVEADPAALGVDRQAVIGGVATPPGAHPAVGALVEGGSATCTGTLIAPDAVLTAAHCLPLDGPLPGFTLEPDARGGVTPLAAAAAAIHPMWDVDRAIVDGPTQFYDLAVLRLAAPVAGVTPMIVAGPREAAGVGDGTLVTLVGYGETVDGDPASAGVKVAGEASVTATSASELQVSAAGEPQNCYGDSGGPAILTLGRGDRLLGVVSRGATVAPTCDRGTVDTRADYYLSWIRQQVPAVCGGDDECAGGPGPGYGADVTGGCASVGGGGSPGAALVIAGAIAVAIGARRRRRRRAIE